MAVLLFFVYLFGQFDMVWDFPKTLFYLHGAIVLIMVGALRGHNGLISVALLMALSDGGFVIFPAIHIDYLHWMLNLLYLLLCIATIVGCWHTRKENKEKASRVFTFTAFEPVVLALKRMAGKARHL